METKVIGICNIIPNFKLFFPQFRLDTGVCGKKKKKIKKKKKDAKKGKGGLSI
jgi:hypothetical protein